MKRMCSFKLFASVAGLVLMLTVGVATAESPEGTFKSLFGDQVRKVAATRTSADDVQLASDIIMTAKTNELPVALQAIMYNKAFELASKSPAGRAVAINAMERLAHAVPEREIECRQKILELFRRRLLSAKTLSQRRSAAVPYTGALMRLADLLAKKGKLDSAVTYARKAQAVALRYKFSNAAEIRMQCSRLVLRRDIGKKRELFEKKLKADPADEASRKKLIELHIIDRDDPAAAAKLLNADSDEMLRMYVALAQKPVDKLETAALVELGQWYAKFAEGAAVASKAAMLRRTERYYIRFLDVFTEKNTKRLKVSIALASVRRELAKLGQSPGAGAPVGASGSWPCSRVALAMLWADATRSGKLQARGKARITDEKAMSLAGGAFLPDRSVNAKLLAACMKSNAFTVEAMIKPDNLRQSGPARIISFSQDGQDRNFTVGQEKSKLVLRVRTVSKSDQNSTETLFNMSEGKWHHVVVSYRVKKDPRSGKTVGEFASYLNGRPMASGVRRPGLLSGWRPMHLIFGDEYADKRDWAGQLKNIAIYTRAVSAKEVAAKCKALGIDAPAGE